MLREHSAEGEKQKGQVTVLKTYFVEMLCIELTGGKAAVSEDKGQRARHHFFDSGCWPAAKRTWKGVAEPPHKAAAGRDVSPHPRRAPEPAALAAESPPLSLTRGELCFCSFISSQVSVAHRKCKASHIFYFLRDTFSNIQRHQRQ